MTAPRLDLILFGATGFTGGLVAERLCRRALQLTPALRWGIAGRAQTKLEALRARLGQLDPAAAQLPIFIADTAQPDSLRALARQARVVISTAGPFIRHGPPVVEACLAEGAHYLDITGEPAFVAQVLARDAEAKQAGVCLINCCGFDSLPHDLGAMYTASLLSPGPGPVSMRGYVRVKGGASGGTIHSLLEALGSDPVHAPLGPQAGSQRPRFAAEAGTWNIPWPTIDPEVIQRSAELIGYGEPFTYQHHLALPSWPQAAGVALGMRALARAAAWPPSRALLGRLSPAPGEGPGPEQRARSSFSLRFVADRGDERVITEVSGGDPGYEETAKMLSEAALCLAFDPRPDRPDRLGALTPAAALGEPLLTRLVSEGIRFRRLL